MSANSSVKGPLLPADSPAPLEDDALEDFLHDVFAGITGITNDLIRPRWQPDDPNQPNREDTWLAFGVMRMAADTYPAIMLHDTAGEGSDELQRHETIEVLISAYGPLAATKLSLLRDGMQVEQNRAVLTDVGMNLQETQDIIPAPTLVKEKWLHRYDMTMILRREIQRVYPVLTLESAKVSLNNDLYTTEIDVTQPTP